jgi:hypothetical protein
MLTSGVGRAGVNDYTLFGDFEYSGNWWLPGRQQDTVGGKVSYQDGQIMLELHKPFSIGGRSPSDAASTLFTEAPRRCVLRTSPVWDSRRFAIRTQLPSKDKDSSSGEYARANGLLRWLPLYDSAELTSLAL